jgi:hypothetical protein
MKFENIDKHSVTGYTKFAGMEQFELKSVKQEASPLEVEQFTRKSNKEFIYHDFSFYSGY